jgi:5-methyltetrahydrofolate--homocysteine methyltransferase
LFNNPRLWNWISVFLIKGQTMADLKALSEAVITGNQAKALELTKAAISEGVSPADILNKGLVAGMNTIGERFKNNEVYIPEVLIAAYAMKAAMAVLEPKLIAAGVKPIAKAVVGTVQGDLHDIGKNLVAMLLKGAGFEVIDLGVDVSAQKFTDKAKEVNAKLIGMSALLTTTMPSMEKTVKAVKAAGLSTKTMIGGAPVTQAYATKIGADGYAADAASAVDLAKSLIK